jgi:uncharacterized repeat protein (TIGR03806 family)
MKQSLVLCTALVLILSAGCQTSTKKDQVPKARKVASQLMVKPDHIYAPQWLSEYGFFDGELANLEPTQQLTPYSLNTPLFSDYAEKERFIYLPEGTAISYTEKGPVDFPDGTVLIKNFYYYTTASRDMMARKRLIETRLLTKEKGKWNPLNYIWNATQTDARLDFVGKKESVNWIDVNGKSRTVNYVIPNRNQCNNCHNTNNSIVPIGTTIAQLNQPYFLDQNVNQLDLFAQKQILTGYDPTKSHQQLPVWNDPMSGNVEQRSRAYLDANCAHCHTMGGSAKNSGLFLGYDEIHPRKRGVFKPPIAAGKGSGNLSFGIVPGKPEESILIYRMKNNDPAIRMPEIGRTIAHEEGIALLTSYIKQLSEAN